MSKRRVDCGPCTQCGHGRLFMEARQCADAVCDHCGFWTYPVTIIAAPAGTGDRYAGGPLDGQPATPNRGQWSIYRDDSGQPIKALRGDAEHNYRHNTGRRPRRWYQLRVIGRDHVYLHADHSAEVLRARRPDAVRPDLYVAALVSLLYPGVDPEQTP